MTKKKIANGPEQAIEHAKIKKTHARLLNVSMGLFGLSVADIVLFSGAASVQPQPKIHETALYIGTAGTAVSVVALVGSAIYGVRKQKRLLETFGAYTEHDPEHEGWRQRTNRDCIKRCPEVRQCMASAFAADPRLTEETMPKTVDEISTMFTGTEDPVAQLELGRALDRMDNCHVGPHRAGLPVISKMICGPEIMERATGIVQRFDDAGV